MAEIYSKIPGLRINFNSVFIYFFLNANKKTDQRRMNSSKRSIITCARLERLTRSYACQSSEAAFFCGPCHTCHPLPLQQQQQQQQQQQYILFPLLRFTRVH